MNGTMIDAIKAIGQRGRRSVDVQFTAKHADLEWYGEQGMRATITDIQDYGDDTVRIEVSFAKFDQHNLQFEAKNYYDSHQNPVLTAREAGCYTVKDHMYFDRNDKFEDYFTELDEVNVYDRYTESGSPLSYVEWLEQLVIEHVIKAAK